MILKISKIGDYVTYRASTLRSEGQVILCGVSGGK